MTLRYTKFSRNSLDGDQPEAGDTNKPYTLLSRDKTSVAPAGFEPVIPASERLQTYVLDCMATRIGQGCSLLSVK
jgi:hypothetical protein